MTNEDLVQSLVSEGYLKTPAIIDAFLKIDRAQFVPEVEKRFAYRNEPLSIGFGQTISQPLTVAFMLELLEPQRGEHVLDVGAGSGWQSSLLAELVRPLDYDITQNTQKETKKATPYVVAIERIPELAAIAKEHVDIYGFGSASIVAVYTGDGSRGFPDGAPYDKIIVAAAVHEIPDAWKEQVRVGGRIVAPIDDAIVLLEKKSADLFEERIFFGFSFVPLVTD